MCDLHEAAQNLRAQKRRAQFEARCIAYFGIAAVVVVAMRFAGWI